MAAISSHTQKKKITEKNVAFEEVILAADRDLDASKEVFFQLRFPFICFTAKQAMHFIAAGEGLRPDDIQ